MTIWGERVSAGLAAAIAAFFMYVSWNFPANGDLFPKFCGFATMLVATLMVIRTVTSPAVFGGRVPHPDWWEEVKPLAITAAVVVYVLVIFRLGYYTSSAIFLCLTAWMAGVRRVRTILVTAIVTFPLMYAFFELFLQAHMPRGLLI